MVCAFAPDGRTFAAAAAENVIHLRDAATGNELQQFRGHDGEVDVLFFLADGKTLASVIQEQMICLWDVADGKERGAPLKLTGSVRAFSPDGRIVAVHHSRGRDRALHLQETATGREIRRVAETFGPFCAFSPDGKTLAVYADGQYAPDDRPILLLEVATGKVRMKLAGHGAMACRPMVFSADGRMLASAGSNMTTLVWDATGRMRGGRFETATLSPKELSDSWAALAGDDPAEAYRAIWALTASPEQTLPLLKDHLRPLAAPDPKATARRLADLDSDDFTVREKAEKELGELGDLVEPALCKALDEGPSPEVRHRVEQLLENLNEPRGLQGLRSLEVLERIGTPGAEKVLREIARGAPQARLTQEANASLERLSRRPSP